FGLLFFCQAGGGMRAFHVTGVQACAPPIWGRPRTRVLGLPRPLPPAAAVAGGRLRGRGVRVHLEPPVVPALPVGVQPGRDRRLGDRKSVVSGESVAAWGPAGLPTHMTRSVD